MAPGRATPQGKSVPIMLRAMISVLFQRVGGQ
jgi:hypothetical protein